MKIRMLSVLLLALVVGLAVVAPAPALGQRVKVFDGHYGVLLPAADSQLVRVTIGNPAAPDPAGDRQQQNFVIQFDRPVDPVTIQPGESYTYVIDPRDVGVLVDARSSLRHLRVAFRFQTDFFDGMTDARPALTIEILHRRTGAVESLHAFPGFTGGVFVAS